MDRFSLLTARPDDIPSPEACARARRIVAMHAQGAADCRDLLEALGLIDPPAEAAGTSAYAQGRPQEDVPPLPVEHAD